MELFEIYGKRYWKFIKFKSTESQFFLPTQILFYLVRYRYPKTEGKKEWDQIQDLVSYYHFLWKVSIAKNWNSLILRINWKIYFENNVTYRFIFFVSLFLRDLFLSTNKIAYRERERDRKGERDVHNSKM